MTGRLVRRLPWMLLVVQLVMVAAHLLTFALIMSTPDLNLRRGFFVANLLIIPSFLPLAALGALIAARHPRNSFGWLLSGIALVWETYALLDIYSVYAYGVRDGAIFGSRFAMWGGNWMFFLALGLVVAFVPLLFPNGRLPPGRWRIVFWMALVGTVCTSAGFAFERITYETDALLNGPSIPNPYSLSGWFTNPLFLIGFPLAIASGVAAGMSIIWRLRRARGIERQQLKWVAYAGALAAAIFVVNTLLFIMGLGIADSVWVLQVLSFAAFPFAAGLAILRYRLFDIDLLIRRTLVYGLLSVSLIAAYLALILVSQSVVQAVTGHGSDITTAAATLGVAALFRPFLTRIRALVDRRFYRSKYDAARLLESFSARLRDELDLTALTAEVSAVVQETMHPTHVSLWLRPAASTRPMTSNRTAALRERP